MKPILHSVTKKRLETFIKRPSHGLLLTGPEGSGKLFIAKWLATESESDYFIIEAPENKSTISIEQIRELYNTTRTGVKLIAILKDSHLLGVEAQNAFLKLLEEPPKNTRFILTAQTTAGLLATIRSRCQLIELLPPPKVDLLAAVTADLPVPQLESLLRTSGGLPGRFFALLQEPEKLAERHQAVTEAKAFYAADPYERHLICIKHQYDKLWANQLLELLVLIVHTLLGQNSSNQALINKLAKQAELLEVTTHNLQVNGNPKLHLSRLSQQLG